MDFGWRINLDSSTATKVPLWGGILIMGRGYARAGVECEGNLCTFITFAVNIKLCQKKKKSLLKNKHKENGETV